MKKRLMSLLLAAMMTLCLLPGTVFGSEEYSAEDQENQVFSEEELVNLEETDFSLQEETVDEAAPELLPAEEDANAEVISEESVPVTEEESVVREESVTREEFVIERDSEAVEEQAAGKKPAEAAEVQAAEEEPADMLATPLLSSIENSSTGVKVTWGKVSGASLYRVFRKEGTGNWTRVADVTGTSYTDKNVLSGTEYSYTVRCVTADGKAFTSAYDKNGLSITYIAAPVLKSAESVSTGVKVTWEKSVGAARYRVYRKEGSNTWTKIADVGNTASYTDKTVVSGHTYSYTVRCLSADGSRFISSFDPSGKSVTYVAVPILKSAENAPLGVKVTWEKSAGASKYRVFRKEGTGTWKKVADVGNVVSYTDQTAVSGHTYTYTVRCLSADGTAFISSFDAAGKTVIYIAAPVLKLAESVPSGVKVSWEKSVGAARYRVYRKEGSGSWTKIADVGNAASYTDKTVVSGHTYSYTVRCLSADGTKFISSFNPSGKKATYVSVPVLKSIECGTAGVTVTWGKPAGATRYRIYRKEGSGSWKKVADVGNVVSYTDNTVVSGHTYTFTVRCLSADGKQFVSSFDAKGLTIKASSVLDLSEKAVYQRMIAMKSKYPEGIHWTNENGYAWNGGYYSYGFGCAGFAFILSDAAFGDLPARFNYTINYDQLRVGDILRINNDSHSVVILEKYSTYVVLAEGNYNSSIHWGRTLSKSSVLNADYYITRYPEN